jgi:MYXO-CTERM domain-containing protein
VAACQSNTKPATEGKGPSIAAALSTPQAASRLANFDLSALDEPTRGASPARLPAGLGGVVSSVHEQRGVPYFVWTPLRPPSPQAKTAAQAARDHLAAYAAAYRLGPAALETVVVRRVHDIGRGGIAVELGQQVEGVDVFRDEVNVMMNRDFALVALSGVLHPAASPGLLRNNHLRFELGSADAIALALTDLYGIGVGRDALALSARRHGYDVFQPAGGALELGQDKRVFGNPARAKKVLFPRVNGLVPAYEIELDVSSAQSRTSDAFRYVIAAGDGTLLYRENLTVADSFTYTVWAEPEAPHTPLDGPVADTTPHPTPGPSGVMPEPVPPIQVRMEGFNTAPGGGSDPWLPAGATVTTGNNVDAYADHAAPDGFGAGDTRADLSSPGTFDYTYDPTLPPMANPSQIKAAVTQLFYVNNWLHDFYYDSGFDEAAGNAQASNFGRGGLEGDPLLAEGQDTGGQQTNNANMQAFADGGSPRMQMYIFDIADPDRDGTIDNGVVAHEWGHYLHIRLANCGFSSQCGAMSEGWGDAVATMMAVRAGDDLNGSYATAAYAASGIGADPAFFGIRRMAYSANFDVNSATFRMISNGQMFPEGMPVSNNSQPNSEVHNAGEIWATVLLEVYVGLLREGGYSFEVAQRRMADYVTAGLKMTPPSATFTEGRDGILAAAAAADTRDLSIIAEAFARRGMGTGAISPPRNSTDLVGVTEDFEVNGSLGFDSSALAADGDGDCDEDGVLDAAETGTLTVTVRNVGAADLSNTTGTIASSNPLVTFPAGTALRFAAMGPFETAVATVPISVAETLTDMDRLGVTVEVSDPEASISPITVFINPRINYDRGASTIDDIEAADTTWVVSSSYDSWQRNVELSGNRLWTGIEPVDIGDEKLISPPLEVSDSEDFVIRFQHRYLFSTFDVFGLFDLLFGGGVIEYSTNDGGSWTDVATIRDPGYGDALTPLVSDNPLAGSRAFTRQNPSLPDMDDVEVNLGRALAGRTVRVRFRLTSAGGVSAPGWEIDEVSFGGVDNAPFDGPVENQGCLSDTAPIADAGDDQTVDEGALVTLDGSGSSDPEDQPLTFTWSQVGGPAVALSATSVMMPTFVAPDVATNTVLTFALVVEAGGERSRADRVAITIRAVAEPPAPPDAGPPDMGEPDAGTPPSEPDAGVTPVDPGEGDDGGCGCRAPGGTGGDAGGALLMLAALGIVVRRRRRS